MPHVDWSEDCFVIEEQGHKADQTGADKFGKHIYANPLQPETAQFNRRADSLSWRQQQDRFLKTLQAVLRRLSEEEPLMLGTPPSEVGAHSFRKGSSTFALGNVSGPNPVSVFMRMGQSLGKLKNRYTFPRDGADQLCGRAAAGLSFSDYRFGVLPPHFGPEVIHLLTQSFWSSIIPGFDGYPVGIRSSLPFLLASLIYHESVGVKNDRVLQLMKFITPQTTVPTTPHDGNHGTGEMES